MRMIDGIPVWGEPVDEGALAQIKTCSLSADYVALMADHHKGYAVPIGGVVAYYDKISPSGVGFDIACGNKAVLTDASAVEVRKNIHKIMDDIWDRISFGVGQKNSIKVEHVLFEDDPAWDIKEVGKLKQMAQSQLGTVGSGNHYVDIFTDELDRVWIGVHFGSRGLGHKIATYFLKEAGAKYGMDVEPCVISVDSNIGNDYLSAMHLAGRYAYAGRDWVCGMVAQILGANILEEVHNHHNFAWKETHFGEDLWVVRKGATPAFPGQRGFVGGTMGENSVILEGRKFGIEDFQDNLNAIFGGYKHGSSSLYSTVHGAGRVMSRTAAAGKRKMKKVWKCGMRGCESMLPIQTPINSDGSNPRCPACGGKMHKWNFEQIISTGRISHEDMQSWIKNAGVELRGAGLDEAPQAYKRLNEVLSYHADSITILHTLKPIGVAMAGAHEFDPYKD